MSRWVIPSIVVLVLLTAVPSAGAQAGSLDTAFSGDGKATTNVTSGFDSAYGVAIQPVDAKIVAAGEVAGSGGRFGLVRYDTDGSLDAGFGGDGRVTTNFTSRYDAAGDVVVQGDGRIVAAGIAGGSGSQFALARYNSDGSLDATFGGDGKVTTNFTAGSDFAFGVLVQPDGKIVAAGRAGGSGGRIAVARYETDGDLDPTFDGDGKVLTNSPLVMTAPTLSCSMRAETSRWPARPTTLDATRASRSLATPQPGSSMRRLGATAR